MMNIGFCGYICGGKTFISNKLKEKYGGRVESIATPLKIFTQEILDTLQDGLTDNYKKIRKPEHRKLLAFLGEKLRDSNFGSEDFWIEKINLEGGENIYIDDIRHPNESEYLKKNGFFIVRLDVNEEEQKDRALDRDGSFDPAIRYHSSETDHLNIQPDLIIDTNGKSPEQIVLEIETALTPLLNLHTSCSK